MYGSTGVIAHIDLCSGTWREERLPESLYRDFIGGRGLAGLLLRPHVNLDWDDPDMPFLVFTGPLTATIAPTSGRGAIMSRSPLTGAIGDASVGGRLATRLKRAGFDGLVITGRAGRLSGIEVNGKDIAIVDAQNLAGQPSPAALRYGRARLGDSAAVMSVGPAAENQVRFASLSVDEHHAAGRCGLGATFAAKNLKYLAVNGSTKVAVHDPEGLKAAREDIFRLTAASPVLMGPYGFTCAGTATLYDLMDNRRMMPTDNFRRTRFEHAASLNAHTLAKEYRPRRHGCRGCHILCKKIAADGRSMPEFETLSHFTALLGNTDMELVLAANALCNNLGMDTISAASALACLAEIRGAPLGADEILELMEDMAFGRGLGKELAQGAASYAEAQEQPGAAMAVKRLDLPAYDPRGAYGMALAYAVSTRGGCHLRAYPISHEILRKPVATDRFTFSGKARIIKITEDVNVVVDSLIACKFLFLAATLEEYARALTAVTGWEFSAQDLLGAGERIVVHERIMNAELGFTSDQDDLPPRFFTEPGSSSPTLELPPLDREAFLRARERYYRIRGCDDSGVPLAETAARLGLEPPHVPGRE